MGNMHIVTGFKGTNHVTAADVGSFQAAVFGTGQYVLNRGSKFSTTTVSNNQIRVADGDLLIQGRHVRLNEGTYVDLAIDNGQADYLRNDLIVARYTKDSSSGVEDVNLVVVKGTPAASSPADPSYTTGDIINDHVYLADMPLWRVPLNGLTVGTLVQLFAEASLAIPDGSIVTAKYAANSITKAKLATNATNTSTTVTLAVADWSSKSQTVNVTGMTANSVVIVSPAADSFLAYGEAQVRATAQASGTLTFTCEDVPSSALTVNVSILS